ncbi:MULTISPECIES: YopX family protein [unclassified Aerococcus]|uniref:YopX family protein n=1 Tax=unclassified Aerococcus TaxID=2618060 RepID=UPI0025C1F68E|nr:MULTISPECIES: YopX family protein [unclassified Aerococcus]
MRDIKFRAWDKKKNDWFDDDRGDLYIELNGNINFGWNGEVMDDYTDRIILMQYTGLKDKNGVEIYDGDFLMAGDAYLGVIKYHSTRAQFIGKNIGETFQEDEYDTLYTKNGRFNSAKVIGNIYENIELLEG